MKRPKDLRAIAVAGALAVVTTAAYHRVVLNGFVNVDDPLYVQSNARVQRGLSAEGVAWAWTTTHAYNWHPLTWISHMVDVELFGLAPAGHHATNLLLHVANVLLLFFLLRRATGATWRSAGVAALVGLHPMHVESVAWVAERKDVLSAFFGYLAVLIYVRPGGSRGGWRVAALACYAASLLAKPTLVTLPALLLVLDFWPLGRLEGDDPGPSWGRRAARLVWEKVPFAALAVTSAAVTFLVQRRGGAVVYESAAGLNAGNALISYPKYLGKLVWPVDLAVLYPFRPGDVTLTAVGFASALLVLALAGAWRLRRGHPWLLAGLAWYVVAMLPVIGFIRIGRHAIADRYAYVPFVGVYAAIVWEAAWWLVRFRARRVLVALAAALVLGVLATLTIQQVERWRSSVTLLEHAIRVTQDNPLAHKNLGIALRWEGQIARADQESRVGRMLENREIVWLHPGNADAHFRLGASLLELDRVEEAIPSLEEAVRLRPALARAHNELGVAYARTGRLAEARASFSAALAADPTFKEAQDNAAALDRWAKPEGGAPPTAPERR